MVLDHHYLNLAYHLALQNEGNTAPNPSVGALVVRGDDIVGQGYHERTGEPHAEVVALRRAGGAAEGATLYCSLEPCAHHGKTPPCVEEIRQARIRRVVFGVLDPNPLVNGKGEKALQDYGIRVDRLQNRSISSFYAPFFSTFRGRRSYVIAKVAMTANGILSPADRRSRWITNETSREWAHQLRARCDAILVGANTVILDRPQLTVRAKGLVRRPIRVVVDSLFELSPENCSLLDNDVQILVCGWESAPANKEQAWGQYGVKTLRFRSAEQLLELLLSEHGIRKVLVEGGQRVLTLFHTAGLIDEYILMMAPCLLTGKESLNILGGPEQSISEAQRYRMDPPIQLDGDVILRMRRNV